MQPIITKRDIRRVKNTVRKVVQIADFALTHDKTYGPIGDILVSVVEHLAPIVAILADVEARMPDEHDDLPF